MKIHTALPIIIGLAFIVSSAPVVAENAYAEVRMQPSTP